jgi:hypothetical protein
MAIYEDLQLIKAENGRVMPGENWAEFTAGLGREPEDLIALGHIAGVMVLEPMVVRDLFSMSKVVERLAEAAEPPIESQDYTLAAREVIEERANAADLIDIRVRSML